MLQLKTVNKALKADVCKHLELERGDDYLYFIYDDGVCYETRSVWTSQLNNLSMGSWIYEARLFLEEIK